MIDQPFFTTLFPSLHDGATIITPNRRLSATLHKCYQQYQLAQEQQYWQTPDILPAASWLQRTWLDYTSKTFASVPFLLSPAQEQFLWETILINTKEHAYLLQISETADLVKSAWALLKQWQVDINNPVFQTAEDYQALHTWVTKFQQQCQTKHYLDTQTLPDLLASKIKELKRPQQLFLVGFNEISPQLNHLLNCYQRAGTAIKHVEYTQHQTGDSYQLSLPDIEQEILMMARWAKSIWSSNKRALVGCVIHSLEKIRHRVAQIFSEVFAENNCYRADPRQSPFNLSAGKSLAQYPVIHAALQALALYKQQISTEVISYLLSSPFLGDAEVERIRRANFDSLLKQGNFNHLDLKLTTQVLAEPTVSMANQCPLLAKRLRDFFAYIDVQTNLLSYQQWAQVFHHLLSILGWPGERSLNSEEFQTVDSWLKLLTDYATLDHIAPPCNIQQALPMLHKLAAKTIFQPKTPDAPIQVLGILEAAGLPFDYLWVAGMDDISWPPQPKPNPFIPKSLQRELKMPHATAERELIYCEQLTAQFKQNARQVIFSYAEKNEELELQNSPLIRNLPTISLALENYHSPSERIYQAKMLELLSDEVGPVFQADEKLLGGADILKQQALCPFKSFAKYRLKADEMEEPLPGLQPKERGITVHKALELVWNKLQDHANLIATEEDVLKDHIQQSVEQALCVLPLSRSHLNQYISLEKQRLQKLLWDWLQLEKQRVPFKVLTSEKKATIKLDQLHFSIRIDRIDELMDGKKLIIDYKTSKSNDIHAWFSERPEEPQLPLYSLLDPANTIGITFAQVAPGESCFRGVSRYELETKGIKSIEAVKKAAVASWDDQVVFWQNTLTKLSSDFYLGAAQVDPKDPNQTCSYCALKPLCRINENLVAAL